MATTRQRSRRAAVAVLVLASAIPFVIGAQRTDPVVEVDADDLRGVVISTTGPEAGVWGHRRERDHESHFFRSHTV